VWGLAVLTAPPIAALALVSVRFRLAEGIPAAAMWTGIGLAVALLAVQLRLVRRVNRPALADAYPEADRYPLRSVAALCAVYFCSFGSELAVVSMLPAFFARTWRLGPALAGATASAYPFVNLFARPLGGLLSDLSPARRRVLRILVAGVALGYVGMALLGRSWPLPAAIVAVMACSVLVAATNGAVYAVAPLVKKRVSGQIAGMIGAYGNLGGLVFLTVLLFLPPAGLFLTIAAASLLALAVTSWLVEPAAAFSGALVDDAADGGPSRSDGLSVPLSLSAPGRRPGSTVEAPAAPEGSDAGP
jgi:NNP family nitrate/nitrite transporter-like MFS transporter